MKEYIQERALAVAGYIIESNATVRQAARQFGISKSTVHKDITERLMQVNPALAKEARKVLDINKSERHIRGGMATKEKYEHEHLLHACQRAVSRILQHSPQQFQQFLAGQTLRLQALPSEDSV